ncbi:MAG: prolipoprotein diacylglyceryl transferase [Coriobacteriia bacterium]|nr:prolipoprotein diacylglyceryl transferase [Coriobacteriia bacterium]
MAYPGIDPVAFTVGPLEVRWYGLAYVVGFIIAGLVMRSLVKRWRLGLSDDDLLDIVLVGVITLVIGARLGYVLFYGAGAYWDDPLSIIAFWDGGMSFHGGLAAVLLGGAWIARKKNISALRLFDLGAVGAPVGLFLGRIANFINGELWGRSTDLPWGMVFPGAPGGMPRHPSQLYEALLEGLVIFAVLWVLSRRRRPEGLLIGTLMALYAVFRTFVEFFREPDIQLGFVVGPFTMGQLLTAPLLIAGCYLVWRAVRAEAEPAVADTDSAMAEGEAESRSADPEDLAEESGKS